MALNPLSVIRVPSPRGAGEKSAEIARPGPGARYRGDQWGLNRNAWAHPWVPGAGSVRYGGKTLVRSAAENIAISSGQDPAEVAELSLEELLVLPDVQAAVSGAVIGVTRWPEPLPPIEVAPLPEYKILQTGGIASFSVGLPDAPSTQGPVVGTGTIPGPVYLKSISVTVGQLTTSGLLYSVTTGTLGTLVSGFCSANSDQSPFSKTIICGFILPRQEIVHMRMMGSAGSFINGSFIDVSASYQNVVRA